MTLNNGPVMHAAHKNGETVGVFSTLQKAQSVSPDSITQITLMQLEGSPDLKEHVAMAKGFVSIVTSDTGTVRAEDFYFDPVWGVNAQSTFAALLGKHLRRTNVTLTEFMLYETDRDYSEKAPESLVSNGIFAPLGRRILADPSCLEREAAIDYIGQYLSAREEAEAYMAFMQSPWLDQIITRFFNMVNSRITQSGSDSSLPRRRRIVSFSNVIRRCLYTKFSSDELKLLAVLWEFTDDPEIFSQIITGKISDNDIKALLQKVDEFVDSIP